MLPTILSLASTLIVVAGQRITNNYPHEYPGKPPGDFSPQWQTYFEVTETLTNVSFDLGRQYAGNLPVQRANAPNNTLFFWGFERENGSLTAASGERSNEPWGIWLNGGPGSSSMLGMFYENGPIHIADDYSAYQNNYSWNHLADYFWIDQPVGVGYSTVQNGSYVVDEDEMGRDFLGFLDNLVKVFPSLRTRPLYLAGESYAGVYIPYITKTYFGLKNPPVNLAKIVIGNGVMNTNSVFSQAPTLILLETFPQLIGYDPAVYNYFKEQHHLCGYDINLTYPQTKLLPTVETHYPEDFANRQLSGVREGRLHPSAFLQDVALHGRLRGLSHEAHGMGEPLKRRSEAAEIWKRDLSLRANGTLDPYYACILLYEIEDYALNYSAPWNLSGATVENQYLGFDIYNIPDALNPELPQNIEVFMNDNRTRAALHAPTSKDFLQGQQYLFGNEEGDPSPVPMEFLTELATNSTQRGVGIIIYSGNNDALIAHWGSEVTIQNTTFGGIQGFTKKPATPWTTDDGTFAGIVHQERNWTYVLFYDAGHLVPQQKPKAALVFLREFVLGSNTTGLVSSNGSIQGGQDPALIGAALPAGPEIFYGSGTTSGTYTYPSATQAAWDSFLITATANRYAVASSIANQYAAAASAENPTSTPSSARVIMEMGKLTCVLTTSIVFVLFFVIA